MPAVTTPASYLVCSAFLDLICYARLLYIPFLASCSVPTAHGVLLASLPLSMLLPDYKDTVPVIRWFWIWV